jgi:hypothetical protein
MDNLFRKIKVIEMSENDNMEENDNDSQETSITGPKHVKNKGLFVKGDSRINRNGRPLKNNAFAQKTRDVLKSHTDPNDPDSPLVEDVILMQLVHDAQDGSLNAVQILLNRAYGNTSQNLTVELAQEEEIDVSAFSDEELYLYLALIEKAESGETPKYYELLAKSRGVQHE